MIMLSIVYTNSLLLIASARLNVPSINMTLSIISSLYASLVALMQIISSFSVFEAFQIMTLNSVSMSVKILIFTFMFSMLWRSCCISIAASQSSDNAKVSAPRTDMTNFHDLMLEYCIRLASNIYILQYMINLTDMLAGEVYHISYLEGSIFVATK